MTLQQLYLICFAAGAVIHGAQTVLVAKLWRRTAGVDRSNALQGVAIGLLSFLWQFGNFATHAVAANAPQRIADFVRSGSLIAFPLLFSYICAHFRSKARGGWPLVRFGKLLGYPLLPWTALAIATLGADELGLPPLLVRPDLVAYVTLHLMLVYFLIFTVTNLQHRRAAESSGVAAHVRAYKAGLIAGLLAVGMFVLMLGGYWRFPIPYLPYIELAAMMTSVPFTISIAYRLYQFPFMDAFLREVLSGVILLAAFVAAVAAGEALLPANLTDLGIVVSAILVAFAKEPLTRWVERTFLGRVETVEEQEERVGNAIRSLTRLDEFAARVSEILRSELEAEWVEIGATEKTPVLRCEIPGSSLWLSAGPRIGGRQYMSRELRIARTAALQLAAHHHQLGQHELRELTARAQMRALQAQINPHFLFNTLNVLSNLIHTNPAKAERVTEELADIFRYALESTRVEWVKLDDELDFLQSYLEIEKARFEERLVYSMDVDASVRSLKIPPMILQPLVENAIRHGIGPKVEGGQVRITGRFDADRLLLVVEDTGIGPHGKSGQRGNGIGLSNVRERLRHVYGESASLSLEQMNPAGTKAVLVLPQLARVVS